MSVLIKNDCYSEEMQRFAFFTIVLLLLGCSSKKQTKLSDNVLAKAFDKTITEKDIANIVELSRGASDSIAIIENYLKNWAINEILYAEADDYYKNDEQINKQVEAYRQTLVLNKYKQVLAEDKIKNPSEKEILDFYNNNKSVFTLSEPILKGAFLSIANGSPNIKKLKEAMRKLDQKSIDEIEQFSLKHPLNYSFFIDNWVKLSDINYLTPKQMITNSSNLAPNTIYEYRDSIFVYMFKVIELKPKNTEMPFELAYDEIKYLLKEKNSKATLEQYLNEMLEAQKKKGNVIINLKNKHTQVTKQ